LPGLDLFSDQVSHTGLTISTSAGSLLQNIHSTGTPNYWSTLSAFGGGITLAQSRPTYGWLVNYDVGTNVTTGFGSSDYSTLNQNMQAQVTWNIFSRWQLRLRDTFFYSDDPFQPFFTYIGTPAPNNPYPITYAPSAIVEQNQAHLDLTYQLSPHDLIDFTGTEAFNRYLRQTDAGLYNSIEYATGAFYQHQFSARLAAGGGYQFAALDFGHGQSRSGVNTFEGFIEYVFSKRLSASLWIGPELTHTKDVVPVFCSPYGCFVQVFHQGSWSVAEGGTLSWSPTGRDSFNMQVSRGVSNAGGFLGVANIYQGFASYGRQITRLWTLGVGLNYGDSTSVSDFRAKQYLKSITGTVTASRRLFNDAWNFNAYYAFIHQQQNYYGLPVTTGTNGLGLTIRYSWSHALGR
jgi:hypothetical protein